MNTTSSHPLALPMIIALAIGIAAVNVSVFYLGFIASDDSLYNSYATQIAAGNFTLPEKHWAFRYTVIVPLAGLIELLGVGESTIQLLTFGYLAALLVLLIVVVHRIAGSGAALWVALLAATAPILITSGSVLNADIPEAIFLFASVTLFYLGWRHRADANGWFLGAGLAAGMAMLTRETAYGIGLFYGLLLLRHGVRRVRPFIWLAIGTFAIVGLEMIVYVANGESPIYRLISATQSHGGINAAGSEFTAGTGNLSNSRIWAPPLALLLNQEFGLLFWLGIGCAVALRAHPRLSEETRSFLRFGYFAALVYFLWLAYAGTIRPLPRYYMFNLVVMLIPIAIFVSVTSRQWLKWLVVLAAVGASYAGLSLDNINQRYPDRKVAEFAHRTGALIATDGETRSRAQSFLTLMGGDRDRLVKADSDLAATAEYFAAVDGRYGDKAELDAIIGEAEAVEQAPAPKLLIGRILDLTRLGTLLPPDKYWWLAVRTPDVTFYRLQR